MKTLMTTALIASTLMITASTTSFAHDTSFSNDACNVELNGGININTKEIVFSKNKTPLYRIVNNDTLIINGNNVDLTTSQQALLKQYSTDIRAAIPEVKSFALDAIDLAIDGVNLAFNELLGEGNHTSTDLTSQLNVIRTEVESEFDASKDFYIDKDGFSGDDFFGDEFEKRIESAVESTIQNSIGSLLIAIGQELLFSDGQASTLEARMEAFGETIEHEVEARVEGLEKRSETLCQSAIAIDQMEEDLKSTIDELADFNVITVQAENKNTTI